MKFKMKRLAVTAILLSSTNMLLADDHSNSSVGDLPGFGEDAYFEDSGDYVGDLAGEEASYEDEAVNHEEAVHQNLGGHGVTQVGVIEDPPVRQADVNRNRLTQSQYAPNSLSTLNPTVYHERGSVGSYVDGGYAPAYGCETACDGGCDGGCDSASSFRKSCGLGKLYDCNTWATYEALLWFPQDRNSPALVSSSAPGTPPVLGPGGNPTAGVNTLFGGEIDGGLSAGFRADYGKWITKNIGVGGRFWWIADNETDLSMTNLNGANASIGRPFFEINPTAPNGVGESAVLVAFNDGTTIFTGDVFARTELQMLGAEAYGRFRLGSSRSHKFDLIGGYSYFRINDGIGIVSETTTIASLPLDPPPGTVRRFGDLFEAKNQFHGGQIGFDLSATRGCWTASSLTKVHMGNMNQRIKTQGVSFTSIGGAPGATSDIGMLVQANNSGSAERDVFTFVPEANFKLAYRFRRNVSLSVGYSFLYFDNVALAGNSIDRAIDGPLLGTGSSGVRPTALFAEDSLWVHGIDLGAVIDF